MKNLVLLMMMNFSVIYAQKVEFNVSVSNDTLLLGNYLELRFEVINGSGTFSPPDLSGWRIVAGPNTASSYSINNGEVSQSSSYTYYLEAPSEGAFIIGSAKLKSEDGDMKTPEIKVVVQANPEGIRQRPKNKAERTFPEEPVPASVDPVKKKRKAIKL